mmetsp:Transcript_37905/g.33924  ORF Transcript_37905/g.33924 Transcript_37905/m.33924 type:complete len:267 (-) Transcript_37905:1031-1831(-)|eukprot:CAMPEP_0114587198 /NCGR_PEP_ID=MMETSP0125-20121206/10220_1 /TAXON_ID=485358 ORGANISM="Aristerostoma sp., Strain ATCC 50986" /NCGR_SAMPLE_ID=MMETSP0125 /ASSEMBLY_ACC=CAM_ASM_000245 /LENGTH=266 /DNA_ID=CAMNT_0001782993 /DNA_START=303 /DNA_END=1103 /DNA_ORIENTATION=-
MVDPYPETLKISVEEACGLPVPQYLIDDGVEADLIVLVTGVSSDEGFLANAQPCISSNQNNRPVYGNLEFNYKGINPTDSFAFANDYLTTLHEFTHILGFTNGLYDKFWDNENDDVKPLVTGEVEYAGFTYTYVDIEPLTTMLQTYFGCETIPGALLENQGGDGSLGSHFERRVFHSEVMTASEIDDARMSAFTLAFLEGTGWYTPDYDMAEPMNWGKNQGCEFYEGPCISGSGPSSEFDEFCVPMEQVGCTWTRAAQAYCGATSR